MRFVSIIIGQHGKDGTQKNLPVIEIDVRAVDDRFEKTVRYIITATHE